MDEYLFDLTGYTVLPSCIPPGQVKEMNDWVDALELEKRNIGDWEGNVEIHSYYKKPPSQQKNMDDKTEGVDDGWNLQHVYEGGQMWEELLDHPSWYGHVAKYLGKASPFVFELFVNVREAGGFIGVHSGGWKAGLDGTPRPGHIVPRAAEHGPLPKGCVGSKEPPEWSCTLVSIILALSDIGPGDGATVLVPGSHKSVFEHPGHTALGGGMVAEGSLVRGAKEMYLKAGDAVIFNDHLLHGAAARINAGQRRMVCFRYLPQHNSTNRFGYQPSTELMGRLSPRRREILTDLNHPWGLNTPARLRGGNSPRASTRQPAEGEGLTPTWLEGQQRSKL